MNGEPSTMRRLFADANYDFLGWRKRLYVGTLALLAFYGAAALYWQFTAGHWLNYGVDFAGGTIVQVRFKQEVSVAQLREVVTGEIQEFGTQNEFVIRVRRTGETTEAADSVRAVLLRRYGDKVEIVRTEAVGAKVGSELQGRAALGLFLSFAAILIYLGFRFEWRFGLAAIIATAFDLLVTLGLISALQLEVALPTVAALLTIVGYSINDKIVVFDRVRDNLKASSRREDFASLVNRSVNETLPRTVLTGSATILSLFALFMFGGSTLRQFAFILIVGILGGTYSSMFIGANALVEIERRWPGQRKKARLAKARAE
jgi:preprotein translocase subunit SecF